MSDTERLRELLLRWEELREQGEAVSPEQLCKSSPGLLPELRRGIQGLAAMNGLLGLPPERRGAIQAWPAMNGLLGLPRGQSRGGPAADHWRAAGGNQALPTLP